MNGMSDKEGLMQMLDAQNQPPPPAPPKVNVSMTWTDLMPEEKAFLSMMAFQSPELAEAIMKKGDDPAFVQKIRASLAETQIREGTRATVERGKVDLSAMQTTMEGILRAREFDPQPTGTERGGIDGNSDSI